MGDPKYLLYILIALGFPGAYTVGLNATGNPETATVIVVIYGIAVAIAGVIQGVWVELSKKLVPHLANGIEKSFVARWRRYRLRYEEFMTYQNRVFDIKGMTVQGPYALELEKVFVELKLSAHVIRKTGNDPFKLPPELATGRHSIWEIASKSPQLVIIGLPGSGKTTLLKFVVLTLCNRKMRRREHAPRLLPVMLFLRQHAEEIRAAYESGNALLLPDIINQEVERVKPELKPPEGWFAHHLDHKQCMVLLDGLDEVADPTTRHIVVEWVQSQMTAYGGNRFMLTSRPGGYIQNPLSGVNVVEVQGFTIQQQKAFIHNWYLANEIATQGKNDSGVHDEAKRGEDNLLKGIRQNTDIQALAVNPLLLTMIATVHKYRSSLPGRRVELYSEMCEAFLGKMRAAHGVQDSLTPAQKIDVLQRLAYTMMQVRIGESKGTREIDSEAAVAIMAHDLDEIGFQGTGQAFIDLVEHGSSILIQREEGIYSFSHKTFQEYLAALYIKEKGNPEELIDYILLDWWHETIRLYCAMGNANPIIRACIEQFHDHPLAMVLAIQCQDEALRVDQTLKQRLATLIEQGVERDE